jgi:outer membrane beta-barrel protein
MLRLSLALTLLLTGLSPGAARAAEDDTAASPDAEAQPDEAANKNGDGAFQRVAERVPRSGTPLIQNKLYPMQFRLEVGAFFDYSFNDKYVDHLGGSGTLGFHIFDWLALEGFGGYLVGGETGIVGNVRNDGSSNKRAVEGQPCANEDAEGCQPQLPDLWQTTWFAGADVQWAPIYGKLSAVSELDLTFQLYGLLGGGAEGITRYLGPTIGYAEPGVRVSVNYGLGVRIIPWKYIALRAELRNYNGLNPNVPEHDPADEDKCTSGYVLNVGGDKQCYPDISQNTMLQVGLSFLW